MTEKQTEAADSEAEPAILLFRRSDIQDALVFWSGIPGLGLNPISDTDAALGAFLDRNPSTSFVCREGGDMIGTVLAGSDGRRGYLYHLAVRSDRRRSGIGGALLRAAADALASIGIPKAHLFVFGHNREAIDFYLREGWIRRNELLVFTRETTPQ